MELKSSQILLLTFLCQMRLLLKNIENMNVFPKAGIYPDRTARGRKKAKAKKSRITTIIKAFQINDTETEIICNVKLSKF